MTETDVDDRRRKRRFQRTAMLLADLIETVDRIMSLLEDAEAEPIGEAIDHTLIDLSIGLYTRGLKVLSLHGPRAVRARLELDRLTPLPEIYVHAVRTILSKPSLWRRITGETITSLEHLNKGSNNEDNDVVHPNTEETKQRDRPD